MGLRQKQVSTRVALLGIVAGIFLWTLSGLAAFDAPSYAQPYIQSDVTNESSSVRALEPASDPAELPQPVNRLLPDQLILTSEEIDVAPIYLDGRVLFEVGAPMVEGQQPAEVRAQEIQRRLNDLTKRELSADEVSVTLDEPSNLPVISAGEQLLMTVTNADAQLGGHVAVGDRAFALGETLQVAFARYQQERQPTFFRQQVKVSIGILGVAALLTVWARRWGKRLRNRQKRLAKANTQLGKPQGNYPLVEAPLAGGFNPVFDVLKAHLDNRQKRKLTEALQGGLILFQIGLWLGALLWILALFPYSRWLTTLLLQWLNIPAEILLLCGLAYLSMRLASLVIDKAGLALQEGVQWAPEQSQRLSLRFSTLSQVAKGLVGSLILGLTILLSLAIAGVQVGPLLAGAGIIGVAISLAAQSLIKDFINGFLILFEDHFGMGDVIDVDGVTGTVEFINLRITQLRNTEGRLITIPNSQISIVQNLSMDWAQVDFSIVVAATEDVRRALELLKKTATELSQDAQWQQFILEPPDLLGVEDLSHTGTTLRLFLKTQPLKQWVVARELRQRIKYAFEAASIAMGLPHDQVAVRLESAELDALAEGSTSHNLPNHGVSSGERPGGEASG